MTTLVSPAVGDTSVGDTKVARVVETPPPGVGDTRIVETRTEPAKRNSIRVSWPAIVSAEESTRETEINPVRRSLG